MMLKVKALAALAAAMSLECVAPMAPVERPDPRTGTSTQGLSIVALPARPTSVSARGWERGVSTGLATSGAQSVYVGMYRDPANPGRFYAFAYDVAGQRNLFIFNALMTDMGNFQGQLTIDLGQWKQSRGTLPSDTGITDGIGTTTPPPRPQLDDMMWKLSFYHHSIRSQIEQESTGTTAP